MCVGASRQSDLRLPNASVRASRFVLTRCVAAASQVRHASGRAGAALHNMTFPQRTLEIANLR
jgi:hypothetical protein